MNILNVVTPTVIIVGMGLLGAVVAVTIIWLVEMWRGAKEFQNV